MLDLLIDGFIQAGVWLRDHFRPHWHREARRANLYPAFADSTGAYAVDGAGDVRFARHPVDWSRAEPVSDPALRERARREAGRWSSGARRFARRAS